jgi:activator of HSP90 ATPase
MAATSAAPECDFSKESSGKCRLVVCWHWGAVCTCHVAFAVTGDETTIFEYSRSYLASPKAVFRALTDGYDLTRMMRAPAKSEAKNGGAFSYMDGVISGVYVLLEEGKTIEMKWRMRGWPAQCYSHVKISLDSEEEGECDLTLTQSGIPLVDRTGSSGTVEAVKNGWKVRILEQGLHKMIGFPLKD